MKLFLIVEDRNGSLNRGGEILIDISVVIKSWRTKTRFLRRADFFPQPKNIPTSRKLIINLQREV